MDFRIRYGLRLRSAVHDLSWNELWCLVEPLTGSPYSHLTASVKGWQRPPEPVESAAFLLMDYHQLVNRKKNGVRPTPIERPWEQAPRDVRVNRVKDDRLRAELMTAFGLED